MKPKASANKPKLPIDRPIFIVGCGRSGSTLLYNMLCNHPDLAWFSTYTDKFPRLLFLSSLSRFFGEEFTQRLPLTIQRKIPKPTEGYRLWDRIKPVLHSPSDPPLTELDFNPRERPKANMIIRKHLWYQNKPRFVNKNTRNTRRMGYLKELYPDVRFIHIVRDPRASVASLIKADWWPKLMIWNQSLITPEAWAQHGKDPVTLAARLWVDETKLVLLAEEKYPHGVYRVQYNALMNQPVETILGILDYCDLPENEKFISRLEKFQIQNMNYKFEKELTLEQQNCILDIAKPFLDEMGFVINNAVVKR